ncbi:hypothetical protein, partial [Actinoallomurus iriomotensis]|uniref:hypothetical protein n=1 Tax=Actinoallomurus iriomotensis TaxID=478107 RepID=UPI002553D6CA
MADAGGVDGSGLTRPQAAALERMGLRPVHVLATGDAVVHAVQAVAPAETSVAAGGRPASPVELRGYLADALAADLDSGERRFWPAVGMPDGATDDQRRAFIAALTSPDGGTEADEVFLTAAAAVLGLRVAVLEPDGGTVEFGSPDGRRVVLVRLLAPGPYTAAWAGTEPIVDGGSLAGPPAPPAPRPPVRPVPPAGDAAPPNAASAETAARTPVAHLGADPFQNNVDDGTGRRRTTRAGQDDQATRAADEAAPSAVLDRPSPDPHRSPNAGREAADERLATELPPASEHHPESNAPVDSRPGRGVPAAPIVESVTETAGPGAEPRVWGVVVRPGGFEEQALWAEVRRELRRLHREAEGTADGLRGLLPELYRRLNPSGRLTLRQVGERIAQTYVVARLNGAKTLEDVLRVGRPLSLLGGGSGKEKEYWYLLRHPSRSVYESAGVVLANGPYGAKLVVETKKVYRGPDSRYFFDEEAAKAAGGSGHAVRVAVPEGLFGVLRDLPGEGYVDPDPAYETELALEAAFEGISDEPGVKPDISLEDILPTGWSLTKEGRDWLIGPRPVGAPSGSHDHLNVGVPPAVGHPFLRHVLENTWRDQSHGYLTRDHLADALEFADHVAARFLSHEFLGYIADDLRPVYRYLDLPDLALQELRDHAATSYLFAAMKLNGEIRHGWDKSNAAVLERLDPYPASKDLLERAQAFLTRDQAAFLESFELRFRQRIPDYRDRYLKHKGDQLALDDSLLSLPADDELPVRAFLIARLVGDPDVLVEHFTGMTVLPGHDTSGGTLAKSVREVRAYKQPYVTAEMSRQHHKALTDVIRDLYPRAVRLHNPTPEDLAEIEQAKAELRSLALPGRPLPPVPPARFEAVYRDAAWPGVRDGYERALATALAEHPAMGDAALAAVNLVNRDSSALLGRDAAALFSTPERPVHSVEELAGLLTGEWGLHETMSAFAAAVRRRSEEGTDIVWHRGAGPRSAEWRAETQARGHRVADTALDEVGRLFSVYRHLAADSVDREGILAAMIAWRVPQGDPVYDIVLAWWRSGLAAGPARAALLDEASKLYDLLDRLFTPRAGLTDPQEEAALTPPHLQMSGRPGEPSMPRNLQRAATPTADEMSVDEQEPSAGDEKPTLGGGPAGLRGGASGTARTPGRSDAAAWAATGSAAADPSQGAGTRPRSGVEVDGAGVLVPPAVGHLFLRQVLEHLQSDEGYAGLLHAHLAEAVRFGDRIAAYFLSHELTGVIADDLVFHRLLDLPDRAVQEVRFHAAMLYLRGAMSFRAYFGADVKRETSAAAWSYDPVNGLRNLSGRARDFLEGFRDEFWIEYRRALVFGSFSEERDRIVEQGGRLPVGDDLSLGDYLLSGLVEDALPHLSGASRPSVRERFLGVDGDLPKVELKVPYLGYEGAPTAEEWQEYHTALAARVEELHSRAVRLYEPSADDIAVIAAERDQLRQMRTIGDPIPFSPPVRLGPLYADENWPAARDEFETNVASWLASTPDALNAANAAAGLLNLAPSPNLNEAMDAFDAGVRERYHLEGFGSLLGPRSAVGIQRMGERGHRVADAPLDHVEALFSAYRDLAPDTDDGERILMAMIAWRVPQGDPVFDIVLAWRRAGLGSAAVRSMLRGEAADLHEWLLEQTFDLDAYDVSPQVPTAPHLGLYEALFGPYISTEVVKAAGEMGLTPADAAALQDIADLADQEIGDPIDVLRTDMARRAALKLEQGRREVWAATWRSADPADFPDRERSSWCWERLRIWKVFGSAKQALDSVTRGAEPGWVELRHFVGNVRLAGLLGKVSDDGELGYLLDAGSLTFVELRPGLSRARLDRSRRESIAYWQLEDPSAQEPDRPVRMGTIYRHPQWDVARRTYESNVATLLKRQPQRFLAVEEALSRLPHLGGPGVALIIKLRAFARSVTAELPDRGRGWARASGWRARMENRGHNPASLPSNWYAVFSAYRELAPDTDDGKGILAVVLSWCVPSSVSMFEMVLAWRRAGYGGEAVRWALDGEAGEFYEWVDRELEPRTGLNDPGELQALTPPHLQVYDRLVNWSITPEVQQAAGAVGLAPREAAALQRVGTLPVEGTDALADVVWNMARRAVVRLDQDEGISWWAQWWPGEPESFPGVVEGARVSVPPILPVWPSPEKALAHVRTGDGPGWVVLSRVYGFAHAAGPFGEATGQGELYYLLDEGDLVVSKVRPHAEEWNGVRVVEVELDSPSGDAPAEDAMSLDGSEEGSSSASSGDGELLLGATRGGLRGGAPGGGL